MFLPYSLAAGHKTLNCIFYKLRNLICTPFTGLSLFCFFFLLSTMSFLALFNSNNNLLNSFAKGKSLQFPVSLQTENTQNNYRAWSIVKQSILNLGLIWHKTMGLKWRCKQNAHLPNNSAHGVFVYIWWWVRPWEAFDFIQVFIKPLRFAPCI